MHFYLPAGVSLGITEAKKTYLKSFAGKVINFFHTKALSRKSGLLCLSPAFSLLDSNTSSVPGASMLHCVTAFFPPSECQNCQSCLLEVGTSARSKDGDFPRRRSTNCNLWQLQKQNSKLSFPGTCNLGSVLQLETKAAHCSCSLLL